MSLQLRVVAASAAVCGLSLAACSSSPSGAGGGSGGSADTVSEPTPSAVVLLKYVSFLPARTTIHAGQTVEWKWEDEPISHNVTFGSFGSSTADHGTYFHTFDTPGTYRYQCTVHQTMTGVVVVQP
jgi:plastocyanin